MREREGEREGERQRGEREGERDREREGWGYSELTSSRILY